MCTNYKKIFAAASIGGHWKQLLRITQPLEGQFEVVYASTHPNCATMVEGKTFHQMSDFSRSDAWRILPSFISLFRIIKKEHPDAILTTGAAPGLVCIMVGWMLRYKTIWVDSIANAEHLSASGRIARRFASRVYTQWPELAGDKVTYAGTIFGDAPQPAPLQAPHPLKGANGRTVSPPLGGWGACRAGIFVTTGTQLPFDRLIRILDELAPQLNEEVVAQVHHSSYRPKHIKTLSFLPPDEFEKLFSEARLIVAHAGMGTILSALQMGKPIIVFPRIAAMGEHRNEHQLATAEKMSERGWVYVAKDESELMALLLQKNLQPQYHIGYFADASLIQSITDFVEKG